jgi:lipase ATG15
MRYEEESKLKNRALVATIIKRVTRSKASGNWIRLFFLLFFIVFAAFIMASTAESFDYKVKGVTFADDFIYEPQPDLPYPTCSVQKGFSLPGQGSSAALADYSFLATMSFAAPEEAQPLLDQWFGEGAVVDDFEYVNKYRAATGTANHPVSYKLFTIPSLPDSAIVSIRGSESLWDWTVDVQLWAGGVLAQFTEAVNPFGYIWRPILDEFVYVINSVQSDELKRVSYYQYTSAFVTELYAGFDGRQYDNLRVTGASLGGGLAILTGAITGASAISMSGLNAMYSRRTFDPPITKEQLNTRTFNVIPDRDPISRIDRPGMLNQHMQCRGPKNSLFACHSMWRTLCEIQYQCGNNGRPINCWCTTKYGYPAPSANSSVTWDEACIDA